MHAQSGSVRIILYFRVCGCGVLIRWGSPDVPLVISSVKTALNIVLDLLFLSKHRVTTIEVDANTQAIIRLLCDGLGATAGLVYYLWLAGLLRRGRSAVAGSETRRPTVSGLKLLARPGSYTFAESALRNALYLWLVSGIVDMGADWANVRFHLARSYNL